MLNWLKSPSGVIVTSSLSLMTFIGRALLDLRYVFPDFMEMTPMNVASMVGINVFIGILWVWALVNLAQHPKASCGILIAMNFIQISFNGLATSFMYCPTPCATLWPVGEIIIWSNTGTGFVAILALIMYKRHKRNINQLHP